MSTNVVGRAVVLALAYMLSHSAVQGAQLEQTPLDSAAEVRRLYENAEYEGALAFAARVDATLLPPNEAREIQLYEALCALALGNQEAAEAKLEGVLRSEPSYRPADGMPNRLRVLTEQVRARLTPELAHAHYRLGKEQFDAKNCAAASTEFSIVLELVPTGGGNAPQHLSDVRTLAAGFLTLCREALATAAPLAPPATNGAAPQAASDPAVVPPVAIRRDLPALPALSVLRRTSGESLSGLLELRVNKEGRVENARLIKRVHPLYDGWLLAATKHWRYEPATRNLEPVDYVLHVKVDVQ